MRQRAARIGVGFIVRSDVNQNLILCTDGDFHHDAQVGPGGWRARVYKTRVGAERNNLGRIVEELARS